MRGFPKDILVFSAGASQFIGTLGPLLAGGPLIAYIASSHEPWRITLTHIGFIGVFLAIIIFLGRSI